MATRPGGPDVTRLYERDDALAALDAAATAAGRSEGRAIFFLGEAGHGKTSLLSVAAARYGRAMALRTARGNAMESDLPFAFLEQALEFMSDPSRPSGGGGGADEAGGPGRGALDRRTELFALARRALRHMADDGPALLLVDDLHWADPDSLQLLGYLVRRSAQLPVVLLGALRPWPPGAREAVDLLVADGFAEVVRLRPLSEPASAALIESLTARVLEGEQADRAWRLTAGNPLLLVEAARVLRQHGRLPAPGRSEPIGRASTLLLSHVAGLPSDSVAVVQAAAVLGQTFQFGALEAVSALGPEAFARAFDIAVVAGLLAAEDMGRGAFHHELLAASIYEDTPPARRRLLHARAFDHCLAVGDEEAAVPHVLAGGLGDDPRSGPLLARAGARALRGGAVETGLARLRRAVELGGQGVATELLVSMGDALFLAGHLDESIDVYRRLLGRGDASGGAGVAGPIGVERELVEAKLADALLYRGHMEEAMALFHGLIDAAAAASDPGRLASLLMQRAHAVWETSGPAAAVASLAIAEGMSIPEPLGELVANNRAAYRHHMGDLSGLPEIERQAIAAYRSSLAGQAPNPEMSGNALVHQVAVCGSMERFDEAEMYIQVGLEQFRRTGALLPTVPLRMQRINILLVRGELAACMSELDDLDEEFDVGSLLSPYFSQSRARVLCFLGDFEGAAAARKQALGLAGGDTWFVRIGLGMAEGYGLLFGGQTHAAAEVFEQVEEVARDAHFSNPTILMWPAGAIEAGLDAGRLEQVERVVSDLENQTRDFALNWVRMLALGGRAGLAAAGDDDAAAARLYEEALGLPCVVPLDRVALAVRYGRWLRQHRQPALARPLLARAVETAERLGALPYAELAHAELAAAGGRRRRAGASDGDGDGGNASVLTTQQARVAALAVTGATTKEIAQSLYLSPRTVESHLGQVFIRLGVRSKAELRRRRTEFAAQLEPHAPGPVPTDP